METTQQSIYNTVQLKLLQLVDAITEVNVSA